MECEICSRKSSSKLPFHCAACARGILYEPRLIAAQLLTEKGKLSKDIEHIVGVRHGHGEIEDSAKNEILSEPARTWRVEMLGAQETRSREVTKEIQTHVENLRDELKAAREDMMIGKAKIAARKADMDTIKTHTQDRRKRATESAIAASGKIKQAWETVHTKAVENRSFLCREAGRLYRLRQKKKMKGGVVRDQYTIGGLPIVDLREINNVRPNELATTIAYVAHLLVLVSFYLSLRLPAEITLPHRDYPFPTIFTPASSYSSREPQSAETTTATPFANSPAASRHGDHMQLPRPRPLFLEPENMREKIPQIAKSDPAGFALFLEGVSLLAWNIAWVCRTQGLHTGTENWEDACNIGRNLWNLLVAPPHSPALVRVLSSQGMAQGRQNAGKGGTLATLARTKSLPRLGRYSHTSAHSFLGSWEAQEVLRGWKLMKHTIICDPLKKALLGEINNAEWELLEEEEWDDGGEHFNEDEAVFIKTRAMDGHEYDDARSVLTARPSADQDVWASSGASRAKGTSGWTKLKSREKGLMSNE